MRGCCWHGFDCEITVHTIFYIQDQTIRPIKNAGDTSISRRFYLFGWWMAIRLA